MRVIVKVVLKAGDLLSPNFPDLLGNLSQDPGTSSQYQGPYFFNLRMVHSSPATNVDLYSMKARCH